MLSFAKKFKIADRTISAKKKPLVIAELSGNHGGTLSQALKLLDACAEAGAEMVKFQTYTPDTITIKSNKPDFIVGTELWKDRSLYDLYQSAHTPFEWHQALFEHARRLGMIPISSPFDRSAVDLLESLDCPAYKIASCEMVDFDLMRRVAATGKPVILSTGASALFEVEEALLFLSELGVKEMLLLHCVSCYPAPAKEANLSTITALAERFNCLVGFSDHTEGLTVPISAVALGAVAIEKHVRLDDDTTSVDSAFSLPASQIKELIRETGRAAKALGTPRQMAYPCEADSLRFRRSLYVAEPVKKGEQFTRFNLRSIRPAGGLHTKYLDQIIGKKAAADIDAGTAMQESMVQNWSPPKNILITSAANKWPLLRLFRQATKNSNIQIIAADMDPNSPAAHHADGFFTLPADSDPDYQSALLHLCKIHSIGMIIPTRDAELPLFARIKPSLEASGVLITLPSLADLALCQDKIAFHDHCRALGFPVAPRLDAATIDNFPVFARRRIGAGGKSAHKVKSAKKLAKLGDLENYLIQPVIDAPEYSCDILSDLAGRVQHVVVRERIKVKKGESTISRIVNKPALSALAKQVAESLSLRGHTLVQMFDHPVDGPLLIEANARFGGCSYLSITGGLNSPAHMIEMMQNRYRADTHYQTVFGLTSCRKGESITFTPPSGQETTLGDA